MKGSVKMKKYKCVIWSDSSYPREYEVSTRSAMKAAKDLGHCEGGEVVQIETLTTGRVLSSVIRNPETRNEYIRVRI